MHKTLLLNRIIGLLMVVALIAVVSILVISVMDNKINKLTKQSNPQQGFTSKVEMGAIISDNQ